MLIVFVATQEGSEPVPAPALRDLMVEDAVTKLPVPIAGLGGWDDDYLQTQLLTFAPCEYSDEEDGVAAFDTGKFWCRRLFKGLAFLTFSDAAATCVITPLFYDAADVETLGTAFTVTATSRVDGDSHYMAAVAEFELNGANKCALQVATPSAGTVYVRQSGV